MALADFLGGSELRYHLEATDMPVLENLEGKFAHQATVHIAWHDEKKRFTPLAGLCPMLPSLLLCI